MADATEDSAGQQNDQNEGADHSEARLKEAIADAAYWKSEAKKAIEKRDKRMFSEEELQEYQDLKKAKEEAEHQKALERGEFEKQLDKIRSKHSEELEAERVKAQAADHKLRSTLIGLEFSRAIDLFGDTGTTVLTPDIAEAYFGRYVDLDEQGDVIVRDREGNEILDERGKRASFGAAMAELIESMPNKNRILRGSAKTGSGSSGGADEGVRPTNRSDLARRAAAGDQEALAELRKSPPGGPSRSVWDRMAART